MFTELGFRAGCVIGLIWGCLATVSAVGIGGMLRGRRRHNRRMRPVAPRWRWPISLN